MRKIIVLSFVSMDSVMQAPGGPTEDPSANFTHGGRTFPYSDSFLGEEMGGKWPSLLTRYSAEPRLKFLPLTGQGIRKRGQK